MKSKLPLRLLCALAVTVLALGLGTSGYAHDDDDDDGPLPFSEIQFFFELNDTDEDLGIQLNLGADPWKKLKILDPDGKKLLEIKGKGTLRSFGLSQLFFESNEPSFDEISMDDILDLFPAGTYTFIGRTVEGDKLRGTASLSHLLPDAPAITAPADGDVLAPDDVTVEWDPVTTPCGVEIASYQVIVTNDEDSRFALDVRLPSDATSFTLPASFFEDDTEYELEVLAVDANGNQTISVLFFRTE